MLPTGQQVITMTNPQQPQRMVSLFSYIFLTSKNTRFGYLGVFNFTKFLFIEQRVMTGESRVSFPYCYYLHLDLFQIFSFILSSLQMSYDQRNRNMRFQNAQPPANNFNVAPQQQSYYSSPPGNLQNNIL